MDAIDKFFNNLNDKVSQIIKPFWDKILAFLSKEYYVLYAAISLVLIILIIPGLFTVLKRAPKFFFFVLVLLGVVIALWYFFVLK